MKTNRFSKKALRIIGGKWRGRKFDVLCAEGLRPTSDRLKETLFNWLMQDTFNAHVADLYSGSGSLGFEALSRGALQVTFLDSNREAVTSIKNILMALEPDASTEVILADTLDWLNHRQTEPVYDVVFVDPPFNKDLVQQTLTVLVKNLWLKPKAKIYVESEKDLRELEIEGLILYKHKKAGNVHYGLFKPV